MNATRTTLGPETRRRLENVARFWQQRYDSCATPDDYVRVAFDRAKAAAKRSKRTTGSHEAMRDLALLLTNWAESQEQAEARRHAP